ncbi:FAD-dependent oxidoreductase [Dactylosporangium sp. NPDC000555]|uniref:FAD-dependent oxidoreductase n=1 Tax=Dactylosporangium sp. NPDC000555 TaxID=3154260 RepID=UPI003318D550
MTTEAVEFDLCVLGFGAAGAAAALEARALGLRTLVVERQPRERHTPSVMMSGGSIMAATDVAAATDYLDACADGLVPREVSAAWAARACELVAWLERRTTMTTAPSGTAEHPDLPGANGIVVVTAARGGVPLDRSEGRGTRLFAAMRDALAELGQEIRYGCTVDRLIVDGERVTGVEMSCDGARVRVHARRGVVLATGGFEFDEVVRRENLPVDPVRFYGNPGNRGDGLRLVAPLGADLWHMDQFVGRGVGSFVDPALGRLNFMLYTGPPGYVITDRHGMRFADESGQAELRHDFYQHMIARDEGGGLPRVPSYWFFDEKRRRAGPLTNLGVGLAAAGIYRWSEDNSAEIARGWIHQGTTVADAATAAGVGDPLRAQATVERYNAVCASGIDPDFGRPADTLLPLDEPPYYCVPLWPGGSHTTGGPRRDAHARILDRSGAPIPGLYGAGELGQATGRLYAAAGASLSDALCFGRIAAAHAATAELR